jgi:hypothetical protein
MTKPEEQKTKHGDQQTKPKEKKTKLEEKEKKTNPVDPNSDDMLGYMRQHC